MRKLTLMIAILILLVPLIHAEPPFESTETSEGGIAIQTPKNEYFIAGQNITLKFFIFNSTNFRLDNTSVSCDIRLTNNTGGFFIDDNLKFYDDFFYYIINSTISSKTGIYPAYVYCNNSEAGFSAFNIEVTEQGRINTSPSGMIAAIIILPLALSFLFLIGSAVLGKDHTALKIFLFILSIPPFFSAMHLGLISVVKFYNFPQLQAAIGDTTYWMSLIFYTVIVYFLIYFIYKAFEYMGKKQKERLEY